MHEASGESTRGWDAAILAAVAQGRTEVKGEIVGFEVVRLGGEPGTRSIRRFRATVRVAYRDRITGP